MTAMNKHKDRGPAHEIIFGINPIMEALKAGKRKIFRLIHKEGAQGAASATLLSLARTKGIPVEQATMERIATLAAAEGSQGVVAQVSPPVYSSFDRLLEALAKMENPVVAILDGIMDPRNLGAIIRSAEAFGVAAVIFPDRRATTYTAVAAKASAGAGEHMRLCQVVNIAEAVRLLREEGFSCVALDSDAEETLAEPPAGPVAVILGGEGTGVRPLVAKRCGRSVKIAMKGKTGSLNVSAAAAIAFHWIASRPG